MDPEGLVTIVPSAGLATMYDHQFQAGVPYFLQWAGPMEAYEQIALERDLPDGERLRREARGDRLRPAEQLADRRRGPALRPVRRPGTPSATGARPPPPPTSRSSWSTASTTTPPASPACEWFTDRGGRAGDKIWLGQWDHGSGCCPNRRGIQWTYALHAWFDHHLAQRDVETGPASELFLSDGTFEGGRTGDRSQILLDSQWPPSSAQNLTLHPAERRHAWGRRRRPCPGR